MEALIQAWTIRNRLSALLWLALLALLACRDDLPRFPLEYDLDCAPDFEGVHEAVAMTEDGTWIDTEGDVECYFKVCGTPRPEIVSDIVAATFSVDDTFVRASIELAKLPTAFENDPELDDIWPSHSWSLRIDVDDDGEYELKMGLMRHDRHAARVEGLPSLHKRFVVR